MHYRKIDYFRRFCALSHEHVVLEQNIDLSRHGLVQLESPTLSTAVPQEKSRKIPRAHSGIWKKDCGASAGFQEFLEKK